MSEPSESPSPASSTEADSATFDQVLVGLRGVVERLESGRLSLEESLRCFEEGVRLSRRGGQILDAAEHRVEVLTRTPAGQVERTPLDPPDPVSSPPARG
jgi:exodeoxyribonuclease VII small subunit